MEKKLCAACGTPVAEADLLYAEQGALCPTCWAEAQEEAGPEPPRLRGAWLKLGGTALLLALAFSCSSRTHSETSFQMSGISQRTVHLGADLPTLILGGLAIIALLATVVNAFRARPRGSRLLFHGSRLALLGIDLVALLAASAAVWHARRHSSTTRSGPIAECEDGTAARCNDLGVNARDEEHLMLAAGLFHDACTRGHALGCTNEGEVRMRTGEPDKAFGAFLAGCKLGADGACQDLAGQFAGDASHATKARQALEDLCESWDPAPCGGLSTMLLLGIGGPQDPRRGAPMARRACDEQGVGVVCNNAGIAYLKGLGVDPDPAVAQTYLSKACAAGWKQACRDDAR